MSEPVDNLIEEIVDVQTSHGTMAVLRKRPRVGHHPGVVIFHDGPGIRNASHVFARQLATAGYDVVLPDLYHRHGRMIGYEFHEREADPTLLDHIKSVFACRDDDHMQADLDAVIAATGLDQSDRLGVVGFCMGARAAFRTLMRLPDLFVAGALWHPSDLCDDTVDSPHLTASDLDAGLFIGIGAEDRMQPVAAHQPFLDAVANQEHVAVEIYAGADQGYTWRDWPSYDEAAAMDSFAKTDALFRELLLRPDNQRAS